MLTFAPSEMYTATDLSRRFSQVNETLRSGLEKIGIFKDAKLEMVVTTAEHYEKLEQAHTLLETAGLAKIMDERASTPLSAYVSHEAMWPEETSQTAKNAPEE